VSGAAAAVRAFPRPWRAAASALTLRRVRRAGHAVLLLELTGFLAWSTVLYNRFALTWDFAAYHQAWFLIAHGDLNPYSSVLDMWFWRNHAEFLIWPLALLYWAWPHGITLLWLQDLSVAAAEAVAFTWLCEIADRNRAEREAAWLAGVGLVLLIGNPWIWWAVSFDVHLEVLTAPFLVLTARDFAHGRRRMWVWAAGLLAGGAVTAAYLAGVGFGGVLAARRSRMPGAIMLALAVAYFSLIATLIASTPGNQGPSITHVYGYLAAGNATAGSARLTITGLARGIAAHPSVLAQALWSKRTDLIANLAPAGLVGLGDLLLLPSMLVVLLSGTLAPGLVFAEPLFQVLPVYILLPVGTVAVLARLAHRCRPVALVLAGLVVTQALGWAVVWAPRTPGQWLRVPPAAAATLAGIEGRIPASAEVIASQGVAGRFSGRADLRTLPGLAPQIPVGPGQTWFVIAPSAGIETQSTASAMALVGELAGPLHATLITQANGVWAFRWWPPHGTHAITVPGESASLPAWAAPLTPGAAGQPILSGPPGTWHVTSTGGKGYVVDGLAWQVPPGQYQAQVSLSASGPVNVEVWNDTGHVLLARRSVPGTTGEETVTLPVNATTAYRARVFSGWGPFRAQFTPPPPGERLELRVWSPGGETVNVYSAELTPAR
jgi:hypothetical protein